MSSRMGNSRYNSSAQRYSSKTAGSSVFEESDKFSNADETDAKSAPGIIVSLMPGTNSISFDSHKIRSLLINSRRD